MKKLVTIIAMLSLLLSSCVSLLPSSYDETVSVHKSYESVQHSYDKIVLDETSKENLKDIGFDLEAGQNIEVLTYVEVSKIFLHNPAINRSDLPEGILECLQAKGGCKAYKFSFQNINKERFGSFWADAFNFRKRSHYTGWTFNALLILVDDKVVYTLHSGQPNIDKTEIEKNPLGPLQGFGGGELLDMAL